MDIRLNELNKTIINCKKCPRLVKYVKKVSTYKRKQNINEIYWGKPVPGFGDLNSKIAFKNYSTNSFLNSFYSAKFYKNKDEQITAFNNYIKNFKSKKNLILVTHYVFISEVLNYGPSSGEIVVSDKNLNIIGSIEIDF